MASIDPDDTNELQIVFESVYLRSYELKRSTTDRLESIIAKADQLERYRKKRKKRADQAYVKRELCRLTIRMSRQAYFDLLNLFPFTPKFWPLNVTFLGYYHTHS